MGDDRFLILTSNTRPASGYAPRVTQSQWERHKSFICELHDRGCTRAEILDRLSSERGFQVSLSQLVQQLTKKWNLRVYHMKKSSSVETLSGGVSARAVEDIIAEIGTGVSTWTYPHHSHAMGAASGTLARTEVNLTVWHVVEYLGSLKDSLEPEGRTRLNDCVESIVCKIATLADVLHCAGLHETAFNLYGAFYRLAVVSARNYQGREVLSKSSFLKCCLAAVSCQHCLRASVLLPITNKSLSDIPELTLSDETSIHAMYRHQNTHYLRAESLPCNNAGADTPELPTIDCDQGYDIKIYDNSDKTLTSELQISLVSCTDGPSKDTSIITGQIVAESMRDLLKFYQTCGFAELRARLTEVHRCRCPFNHTGDHCCCFVRLLAVFLNHQSESPAPTVTILMNDSLHTLSNAQSLCVLVGILTWGYQPFGLPLRSFEARLSWWLARAPREFEAEVSQIAKSMINPGSSHQKACNMASRAQQVFCALLDTAFFSDVKAHIVGFVQADPLNNVGIDHEIDIDIEIDSNLNRVFDQVTMDGVLNNQARVEAAGKLTLASSIDWSATSSLRSFRSLFRRRNGHVNQKPSRSSGSRMSIGSSISSLQSWPFGI